MSENKKFGCLKTIVIAAVVLYILGLIFGDDESSSSNDKASFTCIFCREIFVEHEDEGLIIWQANSIGNCTTTKFYDGSKNGYCSSNHCSLGN